MEKITLESFARLVGFSVEDMPTGLSDIINSVDLSYEIIDAYKKAFKTAWKRIDISTLFFEFSYSVLGKGGHICFISSNQFISTEYGRMMRKFLIKNEALKTVVDFGDLPLFESALTYVSVFLFTKKASKNFNYHRVEKLPFDVRQLRGMTNSEFYLRVIGHEKREQMIAEMA
jgi:type II restriction/modification system DNA methylase subunit YeeA